MSLHFTSLCSAAGSVAFRLVGRRRHPEAVISRLHSWPARTPVNASLRPRGSPTHDLGPSWIATPSMSGVLIPFLMPVYPGAFPTFTTTRSTRSVPSSPRQPRQGYAAALPPGLPDRPLPTGCGVARRIRGGRALLTGPDPPGSGPARRLRGVNAGSSCAPCRLACRTRTVWQCRPVPALSGLLPPLRASPRSGCPQLHWPAATGRRRGPSIPARSW